MLQWVVRARPQKLIWVCGFRYVAHITQSQIIVAYILDSHSRLCCRSLGRSKCKSECPLRTTRGVRNGGQDFCKVTFRLYIFGNVLRHGVASPGQRQQYCDQPMNYSCSCWDALQLYCLIQCTGLLSVVGYCRFLIWCLGMCLCASSVLDLLWWIYYLQVILLLLSWLGFSDFCSNVSSIYLLL